MGEVTRNLLKPSRNQELPIFNGDLQQGGNDRLNLFLIFGVEQRFGTRFQVAADYFQTFSHTGIFLGRHGFGRKFNSRFEDKVGKTSHA